MCNINIDECAGNPCHNGGTCQDSINGFTCRCPEGYHDPTCLSEVNECDSNPCIHGACQDSLNGYVAGVWGTPTLPSRGHVSSAPGEVACVVADGKQARSCCAELQTGRRWALGRVSGRVLPQARRTPTQARSALCALKGVCSTPWSWATVLAQEARPE